MSPKSRFWTLSQRCMSGVTDTAFGTNGGFLTYQSLCGIGPCNWPYADYLARDVYTSGYQGCTLSTCPYSLADLFTGNWSASAAAPFVPITTAAYPPSTFENWGVNDGNVATDPDADVYE